jgi:hypothetical protein
LYASIQNGLGDDLPGDFPWLSLADQLRDIYLWNCGNFAGNASLQSLRFVSLSTGHGSVSDTLAVVRPHAKRLQHLRSFIVSGDRDPLGDHIVDKVEMDSLQGLYVEFYYDAEDRDQDWSYPVPSFLDSLMAPSLRTLHLRDVDASDGPSCSWPRASFEAFIQRSGIALRLQALLIVSTSLAQEDVIHAISLLPNLELLSLRSPGPGTTTTDLVTLPLFHHLNPARGGNILPKLRRLELSLFGRDHLPERLSALAEMTEARSQPSLASGSMAQLKALEIWVESAVYHSDNITAQDSLRRIEICRSHGLRVWIMYVANPASLSLPHEKTAFPRIGFR